MSFHQISKILREWPSAVIPDKSFEDAYCERLRIALKELREASVSPGTMDLCVLIRCVLRSESAKRQTPSRLMIRLDAPWPSREDWREHGCDIVPSGEEDYFLVSAKEWLPEWLDCKEEAPFARVESGQQIKLGKWIPADPAITEAFNRTHYRSKAQADAIRGVVLSRVGSVSVVVLPTGSGKSLVGLSAALIGPRGVSVVIVPTIALGHDQVSQARNECSEKNYHINNWHAGLSTVEKSAIKQRIRNGQQRLIYAAPESVTGALALSLCDAARAGLLRAFIVDEAHIVSQWGDGFRPEFQSMAGLWRQLRIVCPEQAMFRTVLMTATLTEESHDALNSFFKTNEGSDLIASVHLRPEPSYHICYCENQQIQEARVLEALRNSPRPAILYTNNQNNAEWWMRRLRQELMLRVDCIHGGTVGDARERAIERWKRNEVDVMVGTSAFGLGMDKDDVRLVLHACVPETIDRFYQEVGRGGRDGKASVSMLIWTEHDKQVAGRKAQPSLIGDELGLERWRTIFHDPDSKWEVEGEIFLANLNSKRSGILYEGESNFAWNLKTILLLERVGALEIVNQEPPDCLREDGETDQSYESRRNALFEKYWSTCRVRFIGDAHTLEESYWKETVSETRSRTLNSAHQNWRRMSGLLDGDVDLNSTLINMYSIKYNSSIVDVDAGQKGFPVTPPSKFRCELASRFSSLISERGNNLLLVTYSVQGISERKLKQYLLRSLERLVSLGIRRIAISRDLLADSDWARGLGRLHLRAQPEAFVCLLDNEEEEDLLWGTWNLPMVTFISPDQSGNELFDYLLVPREHAHIVIVPEDMRDPRNTHRHVGDVSPPSSMSLPSLISILQL